MFRKMKRFLSILLVFALMCQIMPMSVFAEESTETFEVEEAELESEEEVILEEIPDQRTQYSKEFLTNKGNHMAVLYAEAVHYEEEGEWKEIDNSLILQEDGTYSNAAGVWDVRLPQQLDEEKEISITKDGYTLTFGLAGEMLKEKPRVEIPIVKPGTEVESSEVIREEQLTETLQETLPKAEESSTIIEFQGEESSLTEQEEEMTETSLEESMEPLSEELAEESLIQEEVVIEETEMSVVEESSLPEESLIAEETEGNESTEVEDEDLTETEEETKKPTEKETEKATEEVSEELLPIETEELELTKDGFQIKPMQLTTAEIQEIDAEEAKEAAQFEEFVNEKIMSQLLYADVYENTNVKYDLQSNRVKESVIIEAYNEKLQGYRYTLHTGTMIPILREDGRIDFYDENQRELIMMMEAPFLMDENQELSYDVGVSLEGKDGSYVLEYHLPTEWLAEEERAWPVVLDPVISATADVTNIKDATVASKTVFEYTRPINEVGYYGVDGKERFFIMYGTLPNLKSSDVILGASIRMYKPNTSPASAVVQVHKVNAAWDSQTITWSNQPGYNSTIEDYLHVKNSGYYSFDVTDIVRGWYQGTNTGMMFKAESSVENGTTDNYKEFYSSDYGSDLYMPQLVIVYRNNNGLESYWDYTSSSAGRAGTGYINNYTGNMVWVRSDIGFGGNRMPVTVQHIYNLNDSNDNLFGMGYGWRTNFNQRVYQWNENSDYYVWEDSDGTSHYFLYSSSSTYKDEDGLELTLKTNGSGTTKYSITDKYGNISYFDTKGRLSKMQNNQATKSSITVAYTTSDGLMIDKVTDGAGRVYDFTYSSNLLSKIQYLGSGSSEITKTSFTYSSSKLIKVTDKDGKISQYAYSGKILNKVTDIDGYNLQYTYNSPSKTYQPYRVSSVTEYDGSTAGGKLTIEYAHNQTTFKDKTGNVQVMQFNNMGNTISVQDGKGRAQFAQYAKNDASSTAGKANQLKVSSKLQNSVGSRLRDNSFEDGNMWTVVSGSGSFTPSTADSYYGNKSYKVTNDLTIRSANLSFSAGATQTFSAYVKTVGTTARLEFYNGSTVYASETLPAGSDWTRLQVTYTNTTSSSQTVSARLTTYGTGTTYIDCAQWETAPTASRYNLAQNGDFRHVDYGWSSLSGLTTKKPTAGTQLSSEAYKMTGSPSSKQRINQTVKVSGSAGDTFVLAGWAKGDSVPLRDDTGYAREFAVIGTFNYTDGSTKTFKARFNPDTDSTGNWQYSAQMMVAEKAYSSIKLEVAYDYNVNTVYFDGIQLYKEEFGNSYTYDSKGNVTAVKDIQGETTKYEYSSNNLTKEILPTGAQLTYTYDSYHNVKTATTAEGEVYSFNYDTYGNNTSVSISSGGNTITSTAAYTSDGNRLTSTTNALGDTTTYSYNANTNVLEWVKYPEDTDATKTSYSYDSMYRIASASTTTNTGTALTVGYTYSDDMLTAIQTGSTTYSFAYGDFALRSSTKIGSRTLASYSYSTDGNHYLTSLDYGNGDSVDYSYDKYGNVTKETYEDSETVSYTYDNNGDLATVTDLATGRKNTYYYDTTGRLMKYTEKGSGHSLSVGYRYDEVNNLTGIVEKISGVERTTTYTYDEDNRVTGSTTGNAGRTYSYDGFGRVSQTTTKAGSSEVKKDTYSYTAQSSTKTSGQISQHVVDAAGYDKTYNYTYDDNGNIVSISDGSSSTTYEYDSANQLVRENNQAGGYTYTWTYDDAGNILNRKEYAYTTGTLGTATDTISYSYGDSAWGDLLTAYDGNSYSYDTIGNLTSDGYYTYTWEHGRELAGMSAMMESWSFEYDANGMRTRRTGRVSTYDYVYNGSQLIKLMVDYESLGETDTLYFTYDANGTPLSVKYNGEEFYYVTNIQGDVISILNSSGEAVVSYTYDAWGNILTKTGSLANSLGRSNPLCYRGYVYDRETGLYYVSSRYYDPEIGRWINADSIIAGVGGNIKGYNLFAYCFNNPVNMDDQTGNWPKWIKNTVKGVAKNIVKPIVKTVQKTLSKVDATYSRGINVSGTPSAFIFNLQAGISIDTKGNVAIQGSAGGGVTGGSPGASITAYQSVTNAPSIDKLEGPGYQIGGSVGVPVYGVPLAAGGDFNIIPDSALNTTYLGATTNVGFGTPGGEFHVEWGETVTWNATRFNIFDVAEDVYIKIMEW